MNAFGSSVYLTSCAVTMLAVAGMLIADTRGAKSARGVLKAIAVAGFLGASLSGGFPASAVRLITFVALVLCGLGDLLLIPSGAARVFVLGLVAFLLGHVGFFAAFLAEGVSFPVTSLALLAMAFPVFLALRWLLPHVKPSMKLPVLLYITVISLMVASAVGSVARGGSPLGLVAAIAFFLSDFSVARERFVRDTLIIKLWGTPLYFGAQLVFAAWMVR